LIYQKKLEFNSCVFGGHGVLTHRNKCTYYENTF
jgi:hypothetical protein